MMSVSWKPFWTASSSSVLGRHCGAASTCASTQVIPARQHLQLHDARKFNLKIGHEAVGPANTKLNGFIRNGTDDPKPIRTNDGDDGWDQQGDGSVVRSRLRKLNHASKKMLPTRYLPLLTACKTR